MEEFRKEFEERMNKLSKKLEEKDEIIGEMRVEMSKLKEKKNKKRVLDDSDASDVNRIPKKKRKVNGSNSNSNKEKVCTLFLASVFESYLAYLDCIVLDFCMF